VSLLWLAQRLKADNWVRYKKTFYSEYKHVFFENFEKCNSVILKILKNSSRFTKTRIVYCLFTVCCCEYVFVDVSVLCPHFRHNPRPI
jgi:hypothetical protein